MLAAVIGLAVGCSSGSSTAKQHPASTTSSSRSTTTTTAPPGPEGWTITPEAPVGALGRYAVWTGTEYIGGPAGCCDGVGGSEVVAYSPTTDRWRPLASFPLRPRHMEVAAWTGHEMIVVGGREARDATDTTQTDAVPTTSGAALDPAADTWRSIAPMPAPMEHPLAAVWTGREMVVLDHTRTFVYSPTNDRWRTGTAPPFARDGVVILAAGRRVIVWGGRDTGDAPPGADLVVHADGAVYDPVANRWTTIPNAPVPARTEAAGVWTGRSMIVWGGQGAGGSQATGDRGLLGKGAAYTPSTDTWRALRHHPSGRDGATRCSGPGGRPWCGEARWPRPARTRSPSIRAMAPPTTRQRTRGAA